MSEKKTFLSWVGFKDEESAAPNSVDRIRELESQLSDLRSRRDITTLSQEEFEILATETAMTIIKSAQLREAKAQATSDRVLGESTRQAKDTVEGAEGKARSILSGAEVRGRKFISTAESEAEELVRRARIEAEQTFDTKKREVAALGQAARRESERIISEATHEVSEYRSWLADVIADAENLYRVQIQALGAAENAIAQSRERLDVAFERLSHLQQSVEDSLGADGLVPVRQPMKIASQRAKPALEAPHSAVKKSAKKISTKLQ